MSYQVMQKNMLITEIANKLRKKALSYLIDPQMKMKYSDYSLDELHLKTYENSKQSHWVKNYRLIRSLPEIYQLAFHPAIIEAVKGMGITDPVFTASKVVMRVDMPRDSDFQFPWHQDYPYNLGSENSVTVWIPLQDSYKENGALEILEGDYLEGDGVGKLIEYECGKGALTLPERIKEISQEKNSRHKIVPIMCGEALIFSQFLLHRSGKNISKNARLSLQIRFSDTADSLFRKREFNFSETNDILSFNEVNQYLS